MKTIDWAKGLPFALTLTDADGIILYMNDQAIADFANDGGADLLGKNVFACHPPAAQEKMRQILQTQCPNVYTVEKKGIRKFIYQCPWYDEGILGGLLEVVIPLPSEIPHFVRND